MEQKLVKVPFEVELAKSIQNGDVEGKIITDDGRIVRIVCFDAVREDRLVVLVPEGCIEKTYNYTPDGRVFVNDKSPLDLMLKIPEYMSFKDGDVVMLRNQFEFVYVKNSTNGKYGSYVGIALDDYCLFFDSRVTSEYDESVVEYRHATEEEKQKLIDALKASKEPKAKEYLKRFFNIEVKPECEFKPKDWILIRDDYEDMWCLDIYSHKVWDKDEECYHYYCVGGWSYQCIPYNDQTKHLLGTTDNWEE